MLRHPRRSRMRSVWSSQSPPPRPTHRRSLRLYRPSPGSSKCSSTPAAAWEARTRPRRASQLGDGSRPPPSSCHRAGDRSARWPYPDRRLRTTPPAEGLPVEERRVLAEHVLDELDGGQGLTSCATCRIGLRSWTVTVHRTRWTHTAGQRITPSTHRDLTDRQGDRWRVQRQAAASCSRPSTNASARFRTPASRSHANDRSLPG